MQVTLRQESGTTPKRLRQVGSNAIVDLAQLSNQALAAKRFPTLKRKPKVGEFAFWEAEPGLPMLVRSVSRNNVTLFEPGADDISGMKILATYLDAVDLDAIVASDAVRDPR